jgi:superfamily II DNA/RNA helicase
LRAGLRAGLASLGVAAPTAVQSAAIPPALQGHSVLISAGTGEGKTLAFLLPLAHRLKEEECARGVVARGGRPRALVLLPTRELALQVAGVAKALCHKEKFSVAALVGGRSERAQRDALARPVDVLVATTGRLTMALERGWLQLGDVHFVAIDEADTMLGAGVGRKGDYGGFDGELAAVLKPVLAARGRAAREAREVDEGRRGVGDSLQLSQTSQQQHQQHQQQRLRLVRAALPPPQQPLPAAPPPLAESAAPSLAAAAAAAAASAAVSSGAHPGGTPLQFFIAGATFSRPARALVEGLVPGIHPAVVPTAHRAVASVERTFVRLGPEADARQGALLGALRGLLRAPAGAPPAAAPRVLVFCNSVPSARSTALFLGEQGYAVASLHGDIPPLLRESEFNHFLAGACPLMVCTDAAARGLDFGGGVDAVVLFDFPKDAVEYLHRCGRTGRNGRAGRVVALVGRGEGVLARAIERAAAQGGDLVGLSGDRAHYVPEAQRGEYVAAVQRRRERRSAGGRGGGGGGGGAGRAAGGAREWAPRGRRVA